MSGFAVSSRSSSDAKHVAWSGIIRMRWRLREQPESTTSRMIAAMTAAGSMRSSVTSTITSPEEFYEPFTNTRSWILTEELMALPQGGPGYVVAWHPEGTTGKLWVAVGTVEDFGPNDFDRLADISDTLQDFH